MAVEFDEDKGYGSNQYGGQEKSSKMVAWLISKGVAKSESGANAILITIALVFFALAIYFPFFR